MKKILFPFELNQPVYREAFLYAVKTARNLNAELIMLNVFDVEIHDDITPDEYNQQVRLNWLKAYNEVSKLNHYFIEKHARPDSELNIKFDYRFIHGKLTEEIHKILKSETIDLVVTPISEEKTSIKDSLNWYAIPFLNAMMRRY